MFYKDRIEALEATVKDLTESLEGSQDKIKCMESALNSLGYKVIVSGFMGPKVELKNWDALLEHLDVGFSSEEAKVVCKKVDNIRFDGWIPLQTLAIKGRPKKKSKK